MYFHQNRFDFIESSPSNWTTLKFKESNEIIQMNYSNQSLKLYDFKEG